jgi:hypothetical protein
MIFGQLSYQLHDGHELELMLSGKKPLAMFYENADIPYSDSYIPRDDFKKYVDQEIFCNGDLITESFIDPRNGRPVRTRYELYSIKCEEWRIPAITMVLKTMIRTKNRPDEGLDRMIGSLLGYTDAQNDEYISRGNYR